MTHDKNTKHNTRTNNIKTKANQLIDKWQGEKKYKGAWYQECETKEKETYRHDQASHKS